MSGIFPFFWFMRNTFDTEIGHAQSPNVPIFSVYREAGWLENITTTPQSLSWDTEVLEHAEIPIDGTNTSFDLSAGGHYLVMYSVPVRSTWGNNRTEVQSWLRVWGSTDVPYSYSSSYVRRTNDDFEGYNEGAAVIDVVAGDDLELRIQRTDTNNSASVERTPNRSGINILKLDDEWDYARMRPSVTQDITTTWTDVDLWTTDELDAPAYTASWSDITLTGTGKYLVTYSVAAENASGRIRMNDETRLTLGWLEVEWTRGALYIRTQNGSQNWISSFVWIIDNPTVNQILNLEVRRESEFDAPDHRTIPSKTWITITKLPDSADYVMLGETLGWQDITISANTPVTFDNTIEQGTDLEHDGVNTSEIDINEAWDYMFFHSMYNLRTGTWNGPRENPYLEWQVSGTTMQYGVSGSYNRQANDGDGIMNSSASSAWVIFPWLSSGDTLQLTETNEAAAGASVYVGSRMWIQWVNLFSLFEWGAYFSQSAYRWRDDTGDFNSATWWLAAENTDITDIEKNETIRLRMKVENPWVVSYDELTQFELQWAKTWGNCSSSLIWTSMDVASDDWEMVDTSNISPNAETSATILLDNSWGSTHIQSEGYHSPNGETLVTPASTFTSNSQKEYEFSMQATEDALSSVSYCFRLYNIAENKALELNNYPKVNLTSTSVILSDIWGEAGKINAPADGWWATVSFTWGPYTTPVIVGRTNTYNDGNEALVFEARNVTSTWAEVRLCDSNASNATWCQTHAVETIWYIVVDASQTSSIAWIEAGTFTANQSFDTWPWLITTTYGESFGTVPYVFTSVQTTNGNSPIVTRVTNSTATNFTWGICQQQWSEDDCNGTHPNETFGWIAVDPTVNPFSKERIIGTWVSTTPSNLWSSASFSPSFDTIPVGISQTVTNLWGQDVQIDEIQNVSLVGMEFRSCELDNDDDCDGHAIDTIRWLAIEEWVFAPEYLFDQTHYRWYENNSLNTPVTALADENNSLTSIPWSNEIRLRMLLQNADPDLPLSTLWLNLQYASGSTCDTAPIWSDVGNPGWWEDWLYYDDPSITDGVTLSSSVLQGWWHNLQNYNESSGTPTNPNTISSWTYWEWDFSLTKNIWLPSVQYCFRVLTQNDDEISYSSYAKIDTTDAIDPTITSFTPSSWSLLPIWNFTIDYEFNDAESGIDTESEVGTLQKWDGTMWGTNIAWTYLSLDSITSTGAVYQITGLPYGKYRSWFWIQDNSGNSSFIQHEFYVDEVEFIISHSEIDIGSISSAGEVQTSSGELTVTIKTVGAAFNVTMDPNTDLTLGLDSIPIWDLTTGFWYQPPPYVGTVLSHSWWVIIWSEPTSININGNKNTYTYNLRYSALLDVLENYSAGDYEWFVDFWISLTY